nr:hypothetical protein [Syntrophorhabdaceae bacterium]
MVKTIFEDIKNSIKGIEINEVSYAERGYHLAVEATKGNLLNIIGLLDKKRFYIADMCCVDYVEYLEIVYLFNNHSSLCRIKV